MVESHFNVSDLNKNLLIDSNGLHVLGKTTDTDYVLYIKYKIAKTIKIMM